MSDDRYCDCPEPEIEWGLAEAMGKAATCMNCGRPVEQEPDEEDGDEDSTGTG